MTDDADRSGQALAQRLDETTFSLLCLWVTHEDFCGFDRTGSVGCRHPSEQEDSRIFMRFAKDLGFDLDALHFLFQPEPKQVSETKPIAILAENGPSEGVSRVRLSPLRGGEASRVILVAVGSRLILVATLAAVLWTAITLVS